MTGARISSNRGMARLVVIMAVAAIALVAAIIIPIVLHRANDGLRRIDEQQVLTAERQAEIEYQMTNEGFSAVFETETKKFVEVDKARRTVEPYGATKETEGMYLLVTVADDGAVTSEWVKP